MWTALWMIRPFNDLTKKKEKAIFTNYGHHKTLDIIKFHNFNHKNSFRVLNKDTDLQTKIISIYSRAIGRTKKNFYLWEYKILVFPPILYLSSCGYHYTVCGFYIQKTNYVHCCLSLANGSSFVHRSKVSISVYYWKYIWCYGAYLFYMDCT